jgi:hypothetical protein
LDPKRVEAVRKKLTVDAFGRYELSEKKGEDTTRFPHWSGMGVLEGGVQEDKDEIRIERWLQHVLGQPEKACCRVRVSCHTCVPARATMQAVVDRNKSKAAE